MACANVIFLRLAARRQIDASRRLVVNRGKLVGVSMDGLRSIETLKASGLEGEFFAKWAGYQAKVLNEQQSVGCGSVWLSAVPPALAGLNGVAIIGSGSLRVEITLAPTEPARVQYLRVARMAENESLDAAPACREG